MFGAGGGRERPAGSGAFAYGSALGLGRGSLCGGTRDRHLCAEPILLSLRFLVHYNELQYDSHRGDAPHGGRRVAAGGCGAHRAHARGPAGGIGGF
jgi:hypothetical protein